MLEGEDVNALREAEGEGQPPDGGNAAAVGSVPREKPREQDRKVVSEDVEPAVRARTAVMDPQEPALAVAVGELLQAEVGQVHVNVLGEDGDQGRGCETAHCTKIWLKTGSARL